MWEYEFKIKLSDFENVKKRLESLTQFPPEMIFKRDLYFGLNKTSLFRLRTLESAGETKFLVTLKDKRIFNGCELNSETEFSIDSPSKFEEFCRKLNFEKVIEKTKKTTLYRLGEWNIELNEVDGLGLFLEAERLYEREPTVKDWEQEKKVLLQKLDLVGHEPEIRPYTELLVSPEKKCTFDQNIKIYSDGGCRPNPGTGAWAFVISAEGEIFESSGGEFETTNNRMELTAAIKALENCYERFGAQAAVCFYIDSTYVKNGITQWIEQWKQRRWKSSSKEPVKNIDLWQRLDNINEKLKIDWIWVKGHDGCELNERCDQLCCETIETLKNRIQ